MEDIPMSKMNDLAIELHNKNIDRETVENFQEGYEYKTGRRISFLDAACELLNVKDYGKKVTP